MKFSFIDLFAGCGGLSLGLEQAGVHPVYVNELNTDSLNTYLINRSDLIIVLGCRLHIGITGYDINSFAKDSLVSSSISIRTCADLSSSIS